MAYSTCDRLKAFLSNYSPGSYWTSSCKGVGKPAGVERCAYEEAVKTSRSQTELQLGNENVLRTFTCTSSQGCMDKHIVQRGHVVH